MDALVKERGGVVSSSGDWYVHGKIYRGSILYLEVWRLRPPDSQSPSTIRRADFYSSNSMDDTAPFSGSCAPLVMQGLMLKPPCRSVNHSL